jgi:phospholipase DDHD2
MSASEVNISKENGDYLDVGIGQVKILFGFLGFFFYY